MAKVQKYLGFLFRKDIHTQVLMNYFFQNCLSKIKQYFDYNLAKHFEFLMFKENNDIIITFFTDDYANQKGFKVDQFDSVKKLLFDKNELLDKINTYLSNQE